MTVAERLETLLREHFSPQGLTITDDSHKHAGHAGHREGGETHFRVTVISAAFAGQNRVARHRAVMQAVKPLMDERIHALQLFLHTEQEWQDLAARNGKAP